MIFGGSEKKSSGAEKSESSIKTVVREFVCGGFGGMCLVACGHPLDTIKVRLQTMPIPLAGEAPLYTGVIDCIKKSVSAGGILNLYKGMTPPLCGSIPMFSLGFAGYNFGKRIQQNEDDSPLSYTQIAIAGAFAGLAMTTVMAPSDRIKCLLQVQDRPNAQQFTGPIHCIKHLYKTGGVKSIFRGTLTTLTMEVPASTVYFTTYEFMKGRNSKEPLSVFRTLMAGGTAGVACWVIVYPFDVIKSRMQTAPDGMYKNAFDVLRETIREDGSRVFFRGLIPVILRSFPANAACFLGYEIANNSLKYLGV